MEEAEPHPTTKGREARRRAKRSIVERETQRERLCGEDGKEKEAWVAVDMVREKVR